MAITQVLTAPTTAPSRTQDKTTFDTNVENRLAWDTTNVTELTTWASEANSTATTVSSDAATVAASVASATASAATATTQASNASASAATATTQASNASTSATSAAASFDAFDDIYLGSKASNPTLDNDGNPLQTGALYWNNVSSEMRVYSGSAWVATYIPASGYATSGANSNITSLTGLSTALSASQGGTGQSSYAVGDILYASTTSALSKLADIATGNAIISGGISTAPSWGKIALTTHVSGTLPVANGGTGAATLTSNYVLLGNGTSALQMIAPSTSGNVLTSNGTTWSSTAPAASGATKGQAIAFSMVFGF